MAHQMTCCKCKSQMWLPDSLYEAAIAARESLTFYCAYGHSQVFLTGESEETLLRRERDRLKQETARLHDAAVFAENEAFQQRERAIKAEASNKRLKKRTAAGSCPCCKRTFANMAEHMKHRHPDFVSEAGAKVVPIKRAAAQ